MPCGGAGAGCGTGQRGCCAGLDCVAGTCRACGNAGSGCGGGQPLCCDGLQCVGLTCQATCGGAGAGCGADLLPCCEGLWCSAGACVEFPLCPDGTPANNCLGFGGNDCTIAEVPYVCAMSAGADGASCRCVEYDCTDSPCATDADCPEPGQVCVLRPGCCGLTTYCALLCGINVGGSATGAGSLVSGGVTADFSFAARGNPGVAIGQVHYANSTGADWSGEVACYYQVGNVATFTGVITDGHDDACNSAVGVPFFYAVSDNGVGSQPQPDTIRIAGPTSAFSCVADFQPGTAPLVSGDIQVFPAG